MKDAASTWALVVGIDVYDKVTPQLTGAVRDAIAVVGWLRELGVCDDRILLHASPCAQSEEPLKDLGISPRGCTEPEIWTSLSTLLDNSGSRLFVFLLGHAFFLFDGGCVFITKEADRNALTNIGIDWLAQLLHGRNYERQFILLDGCLNYAYSSSERPTIEPGRHSGAKIDAPLAAVTQWFGYAAAQGETAAEPNSRGAFITTLLDTLNLASPNPGCTTINDATGEYEIDLYAAITNIVNPVVSTSIPTQHPGIRRLSMGPADGQAIVAAVAPKGTVALRTVVTPDEAILDLDGVTVQSRQYLWKRTLPEPTDTTVKLPLTSRLPIGMKLIGWCDMKPATGWRDPDPQTVTTGDGNDVVFTLEKAWSPDTVKVTTIDTDDAVVAAMNADAANAARSILADTDTPHDLSISLSRTGAVVRARRGAEFRLTETSRRIAHAIDVNTPGGIRTTVQRQRLPSAEPRWRGWTLEVNLTAGEVFALGGFAADQPTVVIGTASLSLRQLAQQQRVAVDGLGPVLVELNLPWGRWTTVLEPPKDPMHGSTILVLPESVGLAPLRNTLLAPGSALLDTLPNDRPRRFAVAVASAEHVEVAAVSDEAARALLTEGQVDAGAWMSLPQHDDRRRDGNRAEGPSPGPSLYSLPKALIAWPIGRLALDDSEPPLYFPLYTRHLAYDGRVAPRIEPLTERQLPQWDLLIGAGRLDGLTEAGALELAQATTDAFDPATGLLRMAGAYGCYRNGFDSTLGTLLLPYLREGPGGNRNPDAVILWHAWAMTRPDAAVRAGLSPQPQQLERLAAVGHLPAFRWGVHLGRLVAERYGIAGLGQILARIEDRLELASTWTLWRGDDT